METGFLNPAAENALLGVLEPPAPAQAGHVARDADAEDVRLAARGSREAFDRLVLRHQDAVVNAVTCCLSDPEDALDAAQEAFLKAYRSLGGFRGGCAFRTWLLRIALNTARSLVSRRKAKKRGGAARTLRESPTASAWDGVDLLAHVPDPDASSAPARLLERKELKEAIERAISELDDEAREVIVLRDISGESYQAMAAALRVATGTVKSRVHRARLELRRKIEPWL